MKNKQDNILVSEIPSDEVVFRPPVKPPHFDDLDEEIEYHNHLTEDGYRKVTLSFDGKEPMEKWILRTNQPLKDNYVVFKCEGEKEIFGLIEDEDIPIMDFYFREDEEIEYTSEEFDRSLKERNDPNFLWNLHTFRKHCRETGKEDTNRYYWKWIESVVDESEYQPVTVYVKDGGYVPTINDDSESIPSDEQDIPF